MLLDVVRCAGAAAPVATRGAHVKSRFFQVGVLAPQTCLIIQQRVSSRAADEYVLRRTIDVELGDVEAGVLLA